MFLLLLVVAPSPPTPTKSCKDNRRTSTCWFGLPVPCRLPPAWNYGYCPQSIAKSTFPAVRCCAKKRQRPNSKHSDDQHSATGTARSAPETRRSVLRITARLFLVKQAANRQLTEASETRNTKHELHTSLHSTPYYSVTQLRFQRARPAQKWKQTPAPGIAVQVLRVLNSHIAAVARNAQ